MEVRITIKSQRSISTLDVLFGLKRFGYLCSDYEYSHSNVLLY